MASPATGAKSDDTGAVVKPSETPTIAPAAKPATDHGYMVPAPAVEKPPVEKVSGKMPPLKGSQIADKENQCLQCHTTPDTWDPSDKAQYRSFIVMDALKKDVHYQKGVNCVDCHGGDASLEDTPNKVHQAKEDFRSKLPDIQKFCAHCHANEVIDLRKSVHAKAGEKNARGEGSLMGCAQCHGPLDHKLLPVKNAKSPVYLESQTKTCGEVP